MEELALRVRTFVYTMIVCQCLIQLTVGKPFHKYLKLFSQLIGVCICCNIFFSFFGIVDNGWEQADELYEQWQIQWSGEQKLTEGSGYLEKHILEISTEEFTTQIAALLDTEGAGNYELEGVTQKEGGTWEIEVIGEEMQEEDDFALRFKEAVCRKFSIQEEQLEVKIQ